MFHQQVIGVFASKSEAVSELGYNGLGVDSNGTVMKLDEI